MLPHVPGIWRHQFLTCEPVYKSDSLKPSDETERRVCETERERETKTERDRGEGHSRSCCRLYDLVRHHHFLLILCLRSKSSLHSRGMLLSSPLEGKTEDAGVLGFVGHPDQGRCRSPWTHSVMSSRASWLLATGRQGQLQAIRTSPGMRANNQVLSALKIQRYFRFLSFHCSLP